MANMAAVGKKNKINGSLFEQWISNSCDAYLEEETAFIEKTPEPFHIVKKGENGIVSGYYAKAAQPDYKGILRSGRGIAFEAKHTDTDRIKQNAVTDEQARNLNIYHEFGAVCFVLVSMSFESFYRVPWPVWREMKERFRHKYMSLDELKPYKICADINQIKFLEGIEALE